MNRIVSIWILLKPLAIAVEHAEDVRSIGTAIFH